MNHETQTVTAAPITEKQEQMRTYFRRGQDLAGSERMKQFVVAGLIPAVAGTTLDWGESYLAGAAIEKLFEKRIHDAKGLIAANKPAEGKTALNEALAQKLGLEFIEEWGSDSLYAAGMNTLVRKMTGDPTANYVTEASAFISEWINVVAQVFVPREPNMPFYKKTENFVNPVNVEGVFRMFEALPGVGKLVGKGHDTLDHMLEHSRVLKIGNTIAAKGITGYHIQKNMVGV